jgi:4-amino-4-deoxy-L-arabinose transferase-like glycosyltransferase
MPEAVTSSSPGTSQSAPGAPAPAPSYGRPPAALLLALVTVALVVRLAAVVLLGPAAPAVSDKRLRYDRIAHSLLAGDGFARKGAPSADSPPLYPLFLAGVYGVFGPSDGAARAALAVVDSATVGVVLLLGWAVVGRRAAVLAASVAAVLPYSIFQVLAAGSDTLFLLLHTLALLFLARAWLDDQGRHWAAAGALLALATLCRAVPFLLPDPLAALVLLAGRGTLRHRAGRAALLVVVFAAVLAPWMVRNAVVFHRFVPVQTLGGYQFLLGTLDTESPPRRWSGYRSLPSDPVTRDGYLARRGWERIRDDPAAYAGRLARRTVRMWSRTHSGRFDTWLGAANAVLLALAAAGVALAPRRRALLPLLVAFAYFVAVHTVLMSIFRYLLPVVPILLVLAAVPAARWLPGRWPAEAAAPGRLGA